MKRRDAWCGSRGQVVRALHNVTCVVSRPFLSRNRLVQLVHSLLFHEHSTFTPTDPQIAMNPEHPEQHEEEDDDAVPFYEKPEWADVVPIPQDDGPNPLVPIAYKKECKTCLGDLATAAVLYAR